MGSIEPINLIQPDAVKQKLIRSEHAVLPSLVDFASDRNLGKA